MQKNGLEKYTKIQQKKSLFSKIKAYILLQQFIIKVRFLKTDDKARYQGQQFYFKEGFCWILTLNENSEYLKARIKLKGVNDVNAMALYPYDQRLIYYFIAVINSYFCYKYKRSFVSGNSAFQINDARQLPIIIPNDEILNKVDLLVRQAIDITANKSKEEDKFRVTKLENIRKELDLIICNFYKFPIQ